MHHYQHGFSKESARAEALSELLREITIHDLSEDEINEIYEVLLRHWACRQIRQEFEFEIREPIMLAKHAIRQGYQIIKRAYPNEHGSHWRQFQGYTRSRRITPAGDTQE
jgi:hypothetical protein